MLEQSRVITGDSEASLAHAMVVRIVNVRKGPGFAVQCGDDPPPYLQTLSLEWSVNVLVGAALPYCKTLDDTVTLKQVISVARRCEMKVDVASLEEKLVGKEERLIYTLIEKETVDVMDLCGLGAIMSAWNRFYGVRVEGMTMSSFSGLTPEEAKSSMKEFYTSLYSPPIPSFENTIKDPMLRKLARAKISERVCDSYELIYNAMTASDIGGYDDVTFLSYTPLQVHTLFTV